jgi:hypothetical protein
MGMNEKDLIGQYKKNHDRTTATQNTMVTGMFKDRDKAEKAYNVVEARGYAKGDVNIIMSDKTREKYFKEDNTKIKAPNNTLKGAGAGSVIGGTLGAIVGAIAAIGTSLLIPGLGLVLAGPLAAALAGAGAGGVTGGLIGALIGAGIPEVHAKKYEQAIKDGYIVLGVHPRSDEDAEFIEKEWYSIGGENVYS